MYNSYKEKEKKAMDIIVHKKIPNSYVSFTVDDHRGDMIIPRIGDLSLDCSLKIETSDGKPPYGIILQLKIKHGIILTESSNIKIQNIGNINNCCYLISSKEISSVIIPNFQLLSWHEPQLTYRVEKNNNILKYSGVRFKCISLPDDKRKFLYMNTSILAEKINEGYNRKPNDNLEIISIENMLNNMNEINVDYLFTKSHY